MTHLLISAASKSSGKTCVTLGLAAALKARGQKVQTFKKGPDYIDPSWLSIAGGRLCRNLDFNTMDKEEIFSSFVAFATGADVNLIEGSKGLYDGLDPKGSDSTAALAKHLAAPVVLVFNAQGVTRGVAPLLLGYQAFDADINFAGVILNKVAGARHESKLRAAIEYYTDMPVLGAIQCCPEFEINERHLGLVPSNESTMAKEKIDAIGKIFAQQVDLDVLMAKAAITPKASENEPLTKVSDIRIGVARDSAFGFYYPDDLEGLQAAGAQVVEFNTLTDMALPQVDGLFIGGGFPETHMAALEVNTSLRSAIRDAIEGGMPAFAECGGMMYLTNAIVWNGERHQMVGVIDAEAVMHKKPIGKGYVRVKETGASPWPLLDSTGNLAEFPAHEFHYATIENLKGTHDYAYEMLRGEGLGMGRDGLVYKNLLASFTHQRTVKSNPWTQRFVDFVRSKKL